MEDQKFHRCLARQCLTTPDLLARMWHRQSVPGTDPGRPRWPVATLIEVTDLALHMDGGSLNWIQRRGFEECLRYAETKTAQQQLDF